MRARSPRRASVVAAIGVAMAWVVGCDQLLGGSALHIGECTPGTRRCQGELQQLCDDTSQWSAAVSCGDRHQTCVGEAGCVGECAPREKRCADDTPETCDAYGQWHPGGPCATGTCVGGVCGASLCAPGSDVRCVNHLLERCDAAGQWKSLGQPCCGQCDPTSPATCLTRGNACDDDGDVCSARGACDVGICKSLDGDHAWAHWDPLLSPTALSPSPRYTWNADVVFDHVTRLTWQRAVPAGGSSFSSARKICQSLDTIPGYPTGWRLPTRIELASIVDYSQKGAPFIDPDAFPGTPPEGFWSSSPYADGTSNAWYVLFLTGGVVVDFADFHHRVRCVR